MLRITVITKTGEMIQTTTEEPAVSDKFNNISSLFE